MQKKTQKLSLRKETLVNLEQVTGGTTAATTIGTTSLIMTLTPKAVEGYAGQER